jgi:hypothetical protein
VVQPCDKGRGGVVHGDAKREDACGCDTVAKRRDGAVSNDRVKHKAGEHGDMPGFVVGRGDDGFHLDLDIHGLLMCGFGS